MNPAEPWLTLARHSPLAVVADLDGTVIPFAPRPELARPSAELVAFLEELGRLPGLTLAVVSGRPKEALEQMFTEAPSVFLVAEHGAWKRGEGAWQAAVAGEPAGLSELAAELERMAGRVKGALVERKTWSVTLHDRDVVPRARGGLQVEANAAIEAWLAAHPGYERLEGSRVVEVRSARVRKSLAVPWIRERAGKGARLLALGDDLTDEDTFRALGPSDEAVLVGGEPGRTTAARWRLTGPPETVTFLRWIAEARREGPTSPPTSIPLPIPAPPRGRRAPRTTHRLLAVSNRLPELRTPVTPEGERTRNVGGLVSAVEPALASRQGLWLGWSGRSAPDDAPAEVGLDENGHPALAWIDLPQAMMSKYYNGFCNRALWPLFHTFPTRVRFADDEWDAYLKVNDAFAAAAADIVEPGVPVWAHDYHLLTFAAALRRRGHTGPMGHFLHIPFPGADIFRMIPWAERLLDDLLQYDLLGFHTPNDVANFLHTVGALSPAMVGDDAVEHRGRRIRVRAFPIGIIPDSFQEPPEAGTAEDTAALIQSIAPSRLVIGVDRLDYTKGIPERLEAFARMLELHPEWRGKVSLIQISVPSRADVPEYQEQRLRIETAVGRINGEYGEAHWTPVRYLYRSYRRNHLTQLYRAADVGLVTPLRDGMNLVAKEFVAAQDPAKPGVLLLSKFAGAAVELKDALLTNPYHVDGMAQDLDRALRMGEPERLERHAKLLAIVSRTTATSWAEDFVTALESCRS